MGQNSNKAIIATARPSGHLAQHGPRRPREGCIPLYADVYKSIKPFTKAYKCIRVYETKQNR